MHLQFTAPNALFVDKVPAGAAIDWLLAHPEHAEAWHAALTDFLQAEGARRVVAAEAALVTALQAETTASEAAASAQIQLTAKTTEIESLRTALTASQKEVARLRGKYEMPKYLLVVPLPTPIDGADHAGIRGALDGQWRGDLLRALDEPDSYELVRANGYLAPMAEKVSSLSELSPTQAAADAVAASIARL